MHGEPLMPCSPRKARLLLKENKAKVIQREPFTIQLLHGSSGYKQDITIGVDTGHSEVGVSILSPTKEIGSFVFSLRNNISEKLTRRSMFRHHRRRNLRYREQRYNNRSASTKKGKLFPSVQWKVDAHIRLISFIQLRLPKSRLILETASFDTQKLINSDITNDMYQRGVMYGYANVKAYVLDRDNYTCQCNKNGCSNTLHVHHIKFKSDGGSNNPNNLITLCSKHHKMLHDGKLTIEVKKHKSLKSTTVMSIIRKRLLEYYPQAIETFGYITKEKRISLNIEKSHQNDAFVIAGGYLHKRIQTQNWEFNQANNRSLGLNRKGHAPVSRKVRYPIQSKDIVKYGGKYYTSKGNSSKGLSIVIDIDGKTKSVSSKKVELIYHRKNLLFKKVLHTI